jgi:hypothetical protein
MLTDTAIRALKPKDKPYKVSDGKTGGMFLTVSPKGKKAFRLAYKFQGKAQLLTLLGHTRNVAWKKRAIWHERQKKQLAAEQTLPQPKRLKKTSLRPEKAPSVL